MKSYTALSFLITIAALLFASCEEVKPVYRNEIPLGRHMVRPEIRKIDHNLQSAKLQKEKGVNSQYLIVGASSYNLKGANLYQPREFNFNWHSDPTRLYRDYFITDGTYTGANNTYGWSYNDYTGATYLICLEFMVPEASIFMPGDYPMVYTWDSPGNMSWLSFPINNTDRWKPDFKLIETSDCETCSNPLKISGAGMESGNLMILNFSGTLGHVYHNGVEWIGENLPAELNFKGIVKKI